VVTLTGEPRAAIEPIVLAMLEELLILGALRIRRTPVPAASSVSALPQVLAPVRRALAGMPASQASAVVCNQWHEPVSLSVLERSLLPLLDGAHTHEALAAFLLDEVRAERLRFLKDDQPLTDPSALHAFAQEQVAQALQSLRRKALLTA